MQLATLVCLVFFFNGLFSIMITLPLLVCIQLTVGPILCLFVWLQPQLESVAVICSCQQFPIHPSIYTCLSRDLLQLCTVL